RAVTVTWRLDLGRDETAADLAEPQRQELDARDPAIRGVDVAGCVGDAGERVQLAANDLHDLVLLQPNRRGELHAVPGNVTHLGHRGRGLRPRDVDVDGVLLRDPAQHSLARVFEPVAFGGTQRAAAVAAIVVALDSALQAVRRAAE